MITNFVVVNWLLKRISWMVWFSPLACTLCTCMFSKPACIHALLSEREAVKWWWIQCVQVLIFFFSLKKKICPRHLIVTKQKINKETSHGHPKTGIADDLLDRSLYLFIIGRTLQLIDLELFFLQTGDDSLDKTAISIRKRLHQVKTSSFLTVGSCNLCCRTEGLLNRWRFITTHHRLVLRHVCGWVS